MAKKKKKSSLRSTNGAFLAVGAASLFAGGGFFVAQTMLPSFTSVSYAQPALVASSTPLVPAIPPLNKLEYDKKLLELAHVATSSLWYQAFLTDSSSVALPGATTSVAVAPKPWPVRAAYPRDSRALLPNSRIVAYYGNFYSRGMGVLGQYDPPQMLAKLQDTVAQWQAADPATPVVPAIDYIAIVAQGSAGKDGKYRARMPDAELQKALELAAQVNGVVFLDIQVGLSDLPSELPVYENFLQLPNVHLAIDPEFAMHDGKPPGRVIGSFDASDVNYAAQYLANLVRQYDLPPKILVVHRFTHDMLTNSGRIEPLPEVQLVIDMDGWGGQAKKRGTYNNVIAPEPVQFTGFKLFYKNDILDGETMLTPQQVLELTPAPSFIQYQ